MKRMDTLAYKSGSSVVVDSCQICDNKDLTPILFLGYLPPVNQMRKIGDPPKEQPSYPAQILYCSQCHLVQLGLIVDPEVLFPSEYPYTSGTTRILRENFAELYKECKNIADLKPDDLIVDIGSNDGTLLSNFAPHHRVQGVTPENVGKLAIERGIPTIISYFNKNVVQDIINEKGKAKVVTAANVFAHIENIHEIVDCILELLLDDGIFISESHYLIPLLETVQYDTIYHEHLRYYSLKSIKYLLEMHGLKIIHAKKIPTHGGSVRVYASKEKTYSVRESVGMLLDKENEIKSEKESLIEFKERVVRSKLELYSMLFNIKKDKKRIYGISAPSRASTLVNYTGIDDGILDCVLEIKGSHKIGKYLPGTLIPVEEESRLYREQPEYALLLSWHIADELMPNLKKRGYRGDFIIPLPIPRIVKNFDI